MPARTCEPSWDPCKETRAQHSTWRRWLRDTNLSSAPPIRAKADPAFAHARRNLRQVASRIAELALTPATARTAPRHTCRRSPIGRTGYNGRVSEQMHVSGAKQAVDKGDVPAAHHTFRSRLQQVSVRCSALGRLLRDLVSLHHRCASRC